MVKLYVLNVQVQPIKQMVNVVKKENIIMEKNVGVLNIIA